MKNFQIVRSRRKSVLVEILPDQRLLIRCPIDTSDLQIQDLLEKNRDLIYKKSAYLALLPQKVYSPSDLAALRCETDRIISERLPFWSSHTGFGFSAYRITAARKRFGSCSCTGNLCFSLFLAEYPRDLIDYVILHELCHTMEMNHSPRFYALLSRFMPDWRLRQKALRSATPIRYLER